nr:hypothetical protein [Pedobacter panaciterrae]
MIQNNYRALSESVRLRQNPENLAFTKSFSDELSSVSYADVLTYVKLAMNAVDPDYTQRSKEAGEMVKNHLTSNGLKDVTFKYQGSVMTDTHIKGVSDIDLLAISDKFYSRALSEVNAILNDNDRKQRYQPSQVSSLVLEQSLPVYEGSSNQDLKKLRLDSETILSGKYQDCKTEKPKSIKIYNSNLKREVDIVIANWYDDIRSITNNRGENRGIQIYNKDKHNVGDADYPFLSIQRINERSAETSGRLKKMIRFMKSIKAKSTLGIDLNSFEFNAICYNIPKTKYEQLAYYELVFVIFQQIKNLSQNEDLANNLLSVDGSEYIFRDKPEKMQSLINLVIEVEAVYLDIEKTL